jgi:peptidoglycan/xylan/chitin deacetylase (PgdA/CDA1 family)
MFDGIPNKRAFLAQALERLGILTLLERTIARRRPGLIVLTYHRIAEPGTDLFYDPVISATPEAFRTQIDWLARRTRVLTLDDLLAQVESGSPWREPAMLVTFDDGYRDNFDLAVPILREHGVPATFFIPTAFFESPRLPWWDHVAYTIKQTTVPRLVVERDPAGDSPPIDINRETTTRALAVMKVIRAFLDDTIADHGWFLQRLAERAQVEPDATALGRQLFMTWDQVRELADSGPSLTIGSHAHSHRRLAALDENDQYRELAESKQILEDRLGRPASALAYPYGWAGTYTDETKVLAASAGYQLAFSSHEGVNRFSRFDRYEISRLGVGSADSSAMLRARSALHTAFGESFL